MPIAPIVGLLLGIAAIAAFGVWSARSARPKHKGTSPIGYTHQPTGKSRIEDMVPANLNKDNPEARKMAEGGTEKNEVPVQNTGKAFSGAK